MSDTRAPSRSVTILHTADLHLTESGKAEAGGGVESPFRALDAVVRLANHTAVDLVLVCGDLFDGLEPCEEDITFVLEQFERLAAPAVLIPGNHDCLGDAATFHHPGWARRDMHPHVILNPHGEAVEIPGVPVMVWGRAMIEHTADFQPLQGLPERGDGMWHVAMGHGFFYQDGERVERSSPIFARQIRSSGWDYIALGHKHIHADVSQGSVRAAYPGTPVSSWSGEGHVIQVRLARDGAVLSRIPLRDFLRP